MSVYGKAGVEVRKSRIVKTATKQAKMPTTLAKNRIASCLRFSASRYSGSDKNKYPMIAADKTKRLNIVMGIIIVSFWFFKAEPTACATKTITII